MSLLSHVRETIEITMIKFPEMPDRPGDVGAVDWKITLPVKQQTK